MEYYLPGHIFFSVVAFLTRTKQNDTSSSAFRSVVVSIVFRSLIEAVSVCLGIPLTNSLVRIFIMCLLSFITALIIVWLSSNEKTTAFLVNIFHRDYRTNYWESVFNLEDGCAVELMLKDGTTKVLGNFYIMEEESTDPWIGLSEYCVYKNDKVIQDSNVVSGEHVKLVRMSDIASISVTDWTKDGSS